MQQQSCTVNRYALWARANLSRPGYQLLPTCLCFLLMFCCPSMLLLAAHNVSLTERNTEQQVDQCDRVQEAYLGCSQHTFGFGILAVRLPHTQQSQALTGRACAFSTPSRGTWGQHVDPALTCAAAAGSAAGPRTLAAAQRPPGWAAPTTFGGSRSSSGCGQGGAGGSLTVRTMA